MIPVIGIASGLGAGNAGCQQGPLDIQKKCILPAEWIKMINLKQGIEDKWEHIALLNQELAQTAFLAAAHNPFTLVIGGDHSCGIGTWSGISEAYRSRGEEIALLWIDAHMDSHRPETSESGNIHGMPVATLLGHGYPKLTHILSNHPKIKPENLFLIGIRSFEPPEKEFLEKHNVRIYYIEEVIERGLTAVFSEILAYLSKRKLKYGISLDIDAFDPLEITATGTPVDNGIDAFQFVEKYALLQNYPPIAFEFVEFNPSRDRGNASLMLIQKMLQRVIEVQMENAKVPA